MISNVSFKFLPFIFFIFRIVVFSIIVSFIQQNYFCLVRFPNIAFFICLLGTRFRRMTHFKARKTHYLLICCFLSFFGVALFLYAISRDVSEFSAIKALNFITIRLLSCFWKRTLFDPMTFPATSEATF